jgi:DNA polymerase/3'-5' exonuclease PolX
MTAKSRLLAWIDIFILEATNDTNPASRVARTRALQTVRKTITQMPRVTAKSLREADLTQYMRDRLTVLLESEPPTTFTSINGIGPALAADLARRGIKTRTQLLEIASELPREAQLHLTHNVGPVSRDTIRRFHNLVHARLHFPFEIAGSYRRGKAFSNDVDLLVCTDIATAKQQLQVEPTLTYSDGREKSSFLFRLTPRSKPFKVDMVSANTCNWIPMLLYFTGSKDNNVRMRAAAKARGLLLNQHGLWNGKRRIPLASERDAYHKLGLQYLEPRKR